MSKKVYMDSAAEREATEVGKKFMHSTNVVGDMSRAYGRDLSSVRIHADSDSDRKTAERGVDAFSTGQEVFFARAAFNKNDPASRGLLAHELSHSLQQGAGGEMGGMTHSAPMGAEQGGLIDWFRNLFKKKPKEPNKEDTLNFMVSGESLPEVNGQTMNFKQLNQYANSNTGGDDNTHFKLLQHLPRDEQGQYGGGYTDQRDDLGTHIEEHFKGTDKGHLYSNHLMNASGTIQIKGLNSSRLIPVLKTNVGGSMSNDDITAMYENLLSGGKAALYGRTVSEAREADAAFERSFGKKMIRTGRSKELLENAQAQFNKYDQKEIESRDAQFMTGIQQLKGLYLNQLRHIRNKYGTYITQMHPEDFLNKVGLSFYEDFTCMQDVVQMVDEDKTGQIFDYQNNAEDREFKQLADYYFNAYNILSRYIGTDMNVENQEFDPQSMEIMENGNPYSTGAQQMEGQIGGPGFNAKEYAAYLKRMQKRFKKEKKANRLFGRFK